MMNDEKSLEDVMTQICNSVIKMMIAIGVFNKVDDAADRMGYTPQQLKNLMNGRTPFNWGRFQEFQRRVYMADSRYSYRWMVEKFFTEIGK